VHIHLERYQRFGGIWCLLLQGRRVGHVGK